MSFFAILFALLIEQARPLSRSNPIHAGLRAWAYSVQRNFDAGGLRHGWLAWALAAVLPALLVLGLHWLLLWLIGWPAAVLWSVLVLYVTLGFRQFSHHFTAIRDALEAADEDGARAALADWQQVDVGLLPRSEIVRHVIEYSVIAAHRHVFGVLAWFSILAALGLGPAGAVYYRMAEFVARYYDHERASPALYQAAQQAWRLADWLPARLTALSFAVVGSFEEAIDGWRFHAERFPQDNDGVLLAATAGALNVRLGGEALRGRSGATADAEGLDAHPEPDEEGADSSSSTPGRTPEVGHLRSVVGLVWRAVVVWLLLLALLTLARLLG
ncbi:CobD/CbiB family protein [Acidovorax sp. HDW3]|uniref:CobD/CbiB family protein n=1 Tax=Acidovorax sp. HDW3 TaxID=2714923 RepID=UPI001409F908|nr:CobD/CbiB family protein [Acidovorax sp. HDW3]QIL44595.1 CobD/CbiB family protein [Acidovorax sp. HDW3]